jgi:chaperonin GroEL
MRASAGVKNVAAGCNPMDLRRGSQAAVECVSGRSRATRYNPFFSSSCRHVIQFLEANKRSITTSAEIAQVATISANGDEHVGQLIATAMEKVLMSALSDADVR